jgi:SAM-dependent methyltransferase
MSKEILNQVDQYYSEKIIKHGATPRGVDWNGEESQAIRFDQLLKVTEDQGQEFSILDYGCGYGALVDFLKSKSINNVKYTGFDISREMILTAKNKFGGSYEFIDELKQDRMFDFAVASGIFNVKQSVPDADWEPYVLSTLAELNRVTLKGFSFNILTSYSDKEYMHDYLYYASPEKLFSFCKVHFSKRVALLHDYPLYEFTIIVKK